MESVNLSFLRRTLHTAHDRIHMLLLPQFPYKIGLSDRGFGCSGLSLIVKRNVLRMSRTQESVTYSFFRESTPTCTSVSPTFIVPIGARPFHLEHPGVFSDEPGFPVQPRARRRRQFPNALFWCSQCAAEGRRGQWPRGVGHWTEGMAPPCRMASRQCHSRPDFDGYTFGGAGGWALQ